MPPKATFTRVPLNTKISEHASELLTRLANEKAVTKTVIIEQAIRAYAIAEGITTKEQTR